MLDIDYVNRRHARYAATTIDALLTIKCNQSLLTSVYVFACGHYIHAYMSLKYVISERFEALKFTLHKQ